MSNKPNPISQNIIQQAPLFLTEDQTTNSRTNGTDGSAISNSNLHNQTFRSVVTSYEGSVSGDNDVVERTNASSSEQRKPFDLSAVSKSLSLIASTSTSTTSCLPPEEEQEMENFVVYERYSSFYSDSRPSDILNAFSHFLLNIANLKFSVLKPFRIRCVFSDGNSSFICQIQIFRNNPEKSPPGFISPASSSRRYLIEFQRRSGCVVSFTNFFKRSSSSLQELIDIQLISSTFSPSSSTDGKFPSGIVLPLPSLPSLPFHSTFRPLTTISLPSLSPPPYPSSLIPVITINNISVPIVTSTANVTANVTATATDRFNAQCLKDSHQ